MERKYVIEMSNQRTCLLTQVETSRYRISSFQPYLYRRRKKKTSVVCKRFRVYGPKFLRELADMWSCGISLIVFLTGSYPWGKASGRTRNSLDLY
ncbi:putative Ser/Thr protein kinase [Encephalitozoon intestinalis ATCC 50506]|uniref:Ser/Thr protein kinase n=1 Tax=Encephalitozoon intestinalis (strain ATCC 50506) TaxID=876142 RepID=E0S662_ENCIT|nr:putative Ser/Thr protein kinase [Encephalitozoon intestinalis ATCC 50506]ADM11197.1 putative Ser/Thr protein kinase [Encephalitozoon intestinalis ATCC 50506]